MGMAEQQQGYASPMCFVVALRQLGELLANNTVVKESRFVEMLAEVVARLVRDGHGRAAARVRFHGLSPASQ